MIALEGTVAKAVSTFLIDRWSIPALEGIDSA